jgi:hypothetical protein
MCVCEDVFVYVGVRLHMYIGMGTIVGVAKAQVRDPQLCACDDAVDFDLV